MLIIFRMIKSNSSVISKNIPQKALIYIQKNFTNEINLKTIAEQIPCSPNYLSSLFYKTYKKGISEYINDMRLTYAYNLLEIDPSLPAMEVCYRSGYKSYSHFSNSFKNKFGFSPKKVAKSVTSTINLSSNDYKK